MPLRLLSETVLLAISGEPPLAIEMPWFLPYLIVECVICGLEPVI
jgi:hypothetical protein